MKKAILLLWILILFTMGCSNRKEKSLKETAYGIRYGQNIAQVMDVYLPHDLSRPVPVVVLVHGGAWHWGSRKDMTSWGRYLRDQGFAVFNMDYRLGGQPPFLTLEYKMNDMSMVIDKIATMKTELNLSDRISLIGASAGAHLSLQYAVTKGRGKIAAVISLFGPTDLTNPFYQKIHLKESIAWLVGQPWSAREEIGEIYREASPIFHIEGGEPPILLIHGTDDPVVDFRDSERLYHTLQAAGSTTQLVSIPGGNHGANWPDWSTVAKAMNEWLNTYGR